LSVVYLDTSAFVKTIVDEPESERLQAWLESRPQRASSALVRTEAVRAVRHYGEAAVAQTRKALAGLGLIRLDDRVLDAAADLPTSLRSLDAIHIATAQALGSELAALVTYDVRMAQVAAELGLPVAAP
jgi:predicted nucleic acid-binding protein